MEIISESCKQSNRDKLKAARERLTKPAEAEPAPAVPAQSSKKQDKKHLSHGRLPHGARFDVAYDAEATKWGGTLTINGLCFSSKKSSVFVLLRTLDGMYRDDLDKTTPKDEAAQE